MIPYFVQEVGHPQVYLVQDGQAHWVLDPAEFYALGGQWDAVHHVTYRFAIGAPLRFVQVTGQPPVYEWGVHSLHWVPNPTVFYAIGGQWSAVGQVATLPLPLGTPLPPYPGQPPLPPTTPSSQVYRPIAWQSAGLTWIESVPEGADWMPTQTPTGTTWTAANGTTITVAWTTTTGIPLLPPDYVPLMQTQGWNTAIGQPYTADLAVTPQGVAGEVIQRTPTPIRTPDGLMTALTVAVTRPTKTLSTAAWITVETELGDWTASEDGYGQWNPARLTPAPNAYWLRPVPTN